MAVDCSASQRCRAVTTKPVPLTYLSPESRDVDTEDRGVFEGQTKKSSGPGAKERRRIQGGGGEINDNYLCLLLSNMRKLPRGA